MQVNLTPYQMETIIQELEKKPEQVEDQFSVLNYLKIVKQMNSEYQPIEAGAYFDDIPF